MCCSVLQCVAVCCSVLQCVAVTCNVSRLIHSYGVHVLPSRIAVSCRLLLCIAVCCSVLQVLQLQCVPVRCIVLQFVVALCCSVWHCVAVWYARRSLPVVYARDPLTRTATHCTLLQHTATHCNTLHHTGVAQASQQKKLVTELDVQNMVHSCLAYGASSVTQFHDYLAASPHVAGKYRHFCSWRAIFDLYASCHHSFIYV